MKHKLIYIVVVGFLFSCQEQEVDFTTITPDPVVLDELNQSQLDKVMFIQQTFYEVMPISIEETMYNFTIYTT